MILRFLLDTHILVRWLGAPKQLSIDQARVLREAVRHREPIGVSAMTLLEIALLSEKPGGLHGIPADRLFKDLETQPVIQIVPLTIEIGSEVAAIGPSLRDPGDRVIVATARVHNLRLLTSDERIIESRLVPVVA
jgi:PIN domain nuclease of toxin-antitoxin system